MSVLKSNTCFCPPTATNGAHGLAAIAVTAVSRVALTADSLVMVTGGIGGGPVGLPFVTEEREKSTFGLVSTTTLLPEFSGAPSLIQRNQQIKHTRV